MKKTVFIIFSLLFSSSAIHAQTWEFVGLDSMVIKQLYVSGDTIWAGTSHRVGNLDKSGLYKSIDGGKYWFRLDSSLGTGHVSFLDVDELNTNIIYIIKGISAYGNAGIFYRTTDGGENWQEVQSVANNGVNWFEISAFNKNDIYFIEVGYTNILYRTTDSGVTWKEIGSFPSDSHGNRVTVTLDLLHDSTLYASVKTSLLGAFFYKSTDRGDSWFFVSTPPSVGSEIYTDYFIPDRIYLISRYVSNNSGYNWFVADSGFNMNEYYLSFYQDRQTSKLLYKLKTDGLYSSSNINFYWSKIEGTESLPIYLGPTGFFDDRNMKNIFIEPVARELFLGTAKGIYKTGIITHTEDEFKNPELNFLLKQNFPNPFNPNTTIEYQLKNRAFVSLKVYDILGNEIITLVSEEQPAGNYKVTFDIGIIRSYNFTSGVYIYQIQAGGYVSSRKMIYLK